MAVSDDEVLEAVCSCHPEAPATAGVVARLLAKDDAEVAAVLERLAAEGKVRRGKMVLRWGVEGAAVEYPIYSA